MGDANVKDDIINAAYNHEHGFGSRVDTFKRAHAQQADITMKDVARWYEANVENKKRERHWVQQLRGAQTKGGVSGRSYVS